VSAAAVRRFAGVQVGDQLPPETKHITRLTLFLFGVSYFTSHRLHYDSEFARGQGFDDVLVTATLLSGYSAQMLARWAGADDALVALEERNVSPACAGQSLVISGRVTRTEPLDTGGGLVRCELRIDRSDGSCVVTTNATLRMT
jgi:3-methylfumaryl-CoA hydratase